MSSVGSTKRLCVVFSGRVQGVGFRYTIHEIAKKNQGTGVVRNLWDGDVELVVEGTGMGWFSQYHPTLAAPAAYRGRTSWMKIGLG